MFLNSMSPRVKPYLGAGVGFALNSSDVKYRISNTAINGTATETKNGGASDGLVFGLVAILGAEFFVYNEISLSAEYTLGLYQMTSRSDQTDSRKGLSDVTTKQGSSYQILGFGAAGATLHIYF
jgi:opacity protein-like surface antigen